MKWFALFLAARFFANAAAAAEPLTPDGIAAAIDAQGAEAVVARLVESGGYAEVLSQIQTGAAAWVALAPKLAPGNAEIRTNEAEGLPMALAIALPRNAPAVLAVLDRLSSGLDPMQVCGFVLDKWYIAKHPGYVERATAAVAKVSDPKLQEIKTECLGGFGQARH
jgi:hypothetical protein